ncbi:MAG: hypothetical protein R2826_06990 [Thermoleophilia bacterium]
MPRLTLLVGGLLVATGLVAYVATDGTSLTSLIPSAIGVLLGIAGAVALKPPAQKHAIHGALVIALLGVAGSLANVVKFGQLIDGTAERPAAVLVSTIMFLVLLVYLAFGVRSFVAARRSRGRLSSSEANGSRS